MKVELKMIMQDPSTAARDGHRGIEGFRTEEPEHFLDGPVSSRVAVIDFGSDGSVQRGVPFVPPAKGRKLGRYGLRNPEDLLSRDFNQLSVFSTVLRTIYMFEEADALGRKVDWSFDAPQLLVVPRAGEKTNAFYERDSHSLQFFYFQSALDPDKTIFTSLSQDIVAHETGHAILDGIAPDLYNALSPQSLALHESIADLVALMMAFRSNNLPKIVLAKTQGSIREASEFSWLAEEFGRARDPKGRRNYLRSIMNDKTLDPFDLSRDENGQPNQVSRSKPHDLSLVLTGSLYAVMVKTHEKLKRQYAEETGKSEYAVSGKALAVAANQFKRMVLRALDYLPPGDISFADYGRAVLAADEASHPKSPEERDWIIDEFTRRKIVHDRTELAVKTNFKVAAVAKLDLEGLVKSDWIAYEFANTNRKFFGIPEGVHFRVLPRLDVSKVYYVEDGKRTVRECIFKVSWDVKETNRLRAKGFKFPASRQITAGTMLAIDWETRTVRALLKSDAAVNGVPNKTLMGDRNEMLLMLVDKIVPASGGDGGSGAPWVETTDKLLRVRRSANLLHLAGDAVTPAERPVAAQELEPPAGVDTGAFFNLVERRASRQIGKPGRAG